MPPKQNSWIIDYVKFISPYSEAPLVYNIWSAISVISSVLKRNVFINYKTYTIYPNMYIVLVGPPGVGKGEAMHPAHEYSKTQGLANYIGDRITAPRIVEKLFQGFTPTVQFQNGKAIIGAKDTTATLMVTELPTLLTASDFMYQFLCDTWDKGYYDYETRHKGNFTLIDTSLSLMGSCVPDFVHKLAKDKMSAITSGFSARTIFVGANSKSKTLPWDDSYKKNPANAQTMEDLRQRLMAISNLKGEFILAPEAKVIWDAWYAQVTADDENESEVYKNFKSRIHVHVLKTAMVLSVAQSSTLLINKETLEKAIGLIDKVSQGLDDIFRGVGESDISAGLARIQLYLFGKTDVSYKDLLRDNIRFLDHEMILKILNVLEITTYLSKRMNGNGTYYTHTGQPISRPRKNNGKCFTP